jgi:ABC-2 type transport system ATP-binding protein
MIAFELAGATKRYGARVALARLDLVVNAGATVGLLGPNGAGKTTLLRLLLGYTRPSAGGVRLRGFDPRDPRARRGVGYLPERVLLPAHMRLREFLRLHATLAGLAGAERERALDGVLERTGLAERAGERLGALSKGLAQRAGFAQALLGEPELLLLDEPTSSLDPIGVRDVRDWILEGRARGRTTLLCSHVLTEVERTCDQVVILHEGRIAASGPLEALLRPDEGLEDAFVRIVRGEPRPAAAAPAPSGPEAAA